MAVWCYILGQIFSHLPKPSESEKSTHEDTHQGEQIVTTKSQDHLTSLQECQLSILRLSAKFSFAQPYSFSYPKQDPYGFTVEVISFVFTPDFGLMRKIIPPSRTCIAIVQNQHC